MNIMTSVDTEKSDPLHLDNQLCFSLYAAAHAVKKAYRPLLEEFGLTYPQYLILLVLWNNDGLKVSDIGTKLSLDSGTLTPVLKRLEAQQLVTRARRPSDEREVEIRLTPQGWALRARAVDIRATVMGQLRMSDREIADLKTQIDDLIGKFNEAA